MKQNNQTSYIYKCHKCGIILPVNEMGIPTTSIWKDGHNYCWECITNAPAPKMKDSKERHDEQM